MDRTALAARIQEILRSRKGSAGTEAGTVPVGQASVAARGPRLDTTDEGADFAKRCAAAEASSRVLEILGATLLQDPSGPCVVVDRVYPLTWRHGHRDLAHYHAAVRGSHQVLPWFLGKTSPEGEERAGASLFPKADERSLLFFDLETTGLSGGAGTIAFLVGFGWFSDEGFCTRQFFLRGYGEERALLNAVTREITGRRDASPTGRRDACPTGTILVTYNGRGFDVPLIETRYQFNRLRSPFDALAHVDMLFPARRLWKRRHDHLVRRDARPTGVGHRLVGMPLLGGAGVSPAVCGDADAAPGSCALTALERDILGLQRHDDVPGWEIPARYFGYARTGDASGLAAVLEHNRLDLVSLGAVCAVVLEMVCEGASVARERPDCLALARLLDYLGRAEEAERCYSAAAEADGMLEAAVDRHVRAEALHWLALHRRRARRFGDAADAWQQLVDVPGLDAERRREALEALAIHHEHRAKDLEAARAFAVSALEFANDARRVDDVRHRLGRLSRKLAGQAAAATSLNLEQPS